MPKELDPGMLAYREYELFLPNAPAASIAITLGDLAHDSPAARFARRSGATHYGLVAVLNVLNAPDHPVVWSLHEDVLALTTRQIDSCLSADLRRMIARLLVIFFHEIREVAPELSALNITVANDGPLN